METKRHIYVAPECITVAIATERGILTVSQTNMTLMILDFGNESTNHLHDGGDLDLL